MAPVKSKALGTRPERRTISPVGVRIRAARAAAGMTQQQLAGDRYTKAYISALENGLVRPSVAALEYLAPRLGSTASGLLADSQPAWSRVDADLQLASGNYQAAADSYRELLAAADLDRSSKAELLSGLAEAEVRLVHPDEAVKSASEAAEIFERIGRPEDAALANYWLSAGLYEQDNLAEAKAILQALLAKVRMGLRVAPDFKMRLLMALSSNEARDGNHELALSYLTEVRALEDTLDERRRASLLSDLAYSYYETGDYEAAIRTGYSALALFRTRETAAEIASLENDMALAHLATGNLERAEELANSALDRWEKAGNDKRRVHVLDTLAQIQIGRHDWTEALSLATESLELARSIDNKPAVSDALLTIARAHAGAAADSGAKKDVETARAAFETAVSDARQSGKQQTTKHALTEYAEFLAANGDHKQAFELTREALGTTR